MRNLKLKKVKEDEYGVYIYANGAHYRPVLAWFQWGRTTTGRFHKGTLLNCVTETDLKKGDEVQVHLLTYTPYIMINESYCWTAHHPYDVEMPPEVAEKRQQWLEKVKDNHG